MGPESWMEQTLTRLGKAVRVTGLLGVGERMDRGSVQGGNILDSRRLLDAYVGISIGPRVCEGAIQERGLNWRHKLRT